MMRKVMLHLMGKIQLIFHLQVDAKEVWSDHHVKVFQMVREWKLVVAMEIIPYNTIEMIMSASETASWMVFHQGK